MRTTRGSAAESRSETTSARLDPPEVGEDIEAHQHESAPAFAARRASCARRARHLCRGFSSSLSRARHLATVKETRRAGSAPSSRSRRAVGGQEGTSSAPHREQLAKGMDRKVWPSGGTLIIDRTEGDDGSHRHVNTGRRFIGAGGTSSKETVTRNNLEGRRRDCPPTAPA